MKKQDFKPPVNKGELLDLISSSRKKIFEISGNLDDSQFQQIPGPQKDRSLKDIFIHLLWWENFMMNRIMMIKANVNPPIIENADAINEQIFKSTHNLTSETVRNEFKNGEERLRVFIENLSWEEIVESLRYNNEPIAFLIAGNTFGHYAHHLPKIEAFVNSV